MRKKLIAVFQKPSPNNDYARSIVQLKVFNELSLHYDITDVHPKDLNIPEYKGSPGSINSVQNMTIINPENNKSIIFNIGPKLEPSFLPKHGFDHLNIVQVIGGSSLSSDFYNSTSEDIRKKIDTIRKPLTFPLDKISQEQIAYNYPINREGNKIKKAIFIGNTLPGSLIGRNKLMNILNKHPYFEVIQSIREGGIPFKEYLDKMNEYKLSLSLNGFAEACYRDWESMAISLPIVRSEFYSKYYNEIIPNYHYISATQPPRNGMIGYSTSIENIAEQFITKVEEVIDNDDFLNQIGRNGRDFFEKNIMSEKIKENFFKQVNLDLLW